MEAWMRDVAIAETEILVQSHNIDLGDALRGYAREKLLHISKRFFGKITECNVHFRREGSMYSCTGNIKIGALPVITAQAEHVKPQKAFDHMIRRLNQQLSRMKHALRHDKPLRDDKTVHLDGEVRIVGQRAAAEPHDPEHRPARLAEIAGIAPEEPPHNLLSMEGADAYTKAMTQKARQDADDLRDTERATEDDIAAYRQSRMPMAAE
jgi:ribosomal subunit interface protein